MNKPWLFLYSASALLAISPLLGTTSTWTGTVDSQIALDGNWTPSRPTQPTPTAGDIALFADAASAFTPALASGGIFALYEARLNEEDSVYVFSVSSSSTLTFGISGETTSNYTSGVTTTNAPSAQQEFSIQEGGGILFYGLSSAGGSSDLDVKYTTGHSSSGSIIFQDEASAGYAKFHVGTTSGLSSITFEGSSSAAFSDLIIGAGEDEFEKVGSIIFQDSASAHNASIHLGDSSGESTCTFEDTSTLSLGSVEIDGIGSEEPLRGTLNFFNSASAGGINSEERSYIIVGNIIGLNNTSGECNFYDSSTAEYASISVGDHLGDSTLDFYDTSTAGNSTIHVGSLYDFFKPIVGVVTFHDSSTAANSTIRLEDLYGDSSLYFEDDSTAGNATILLGKNNSDHSATLSFNKNLAGTPSAENATIEAHHGSSVEFHLGSSSGTCSIALLNQSTALFQGPASYTVSSLSSDSTCTISIPSAALTIDYSGEEPIEIAGPITNEDDGSLIKEGTGTLILSGANLYTGGTFVEDGKLILTGSLVSDVTVNGGEFSGTGSITGNYIQGSSSTFIANIEGYTNTPLAITGSATIADSPIELILTGTQYHINFPYDVLTATEGVTGTFTETPFDFTGHGLNSELVDIVITQASDKIEVFLQSTLLNAGGTSNAKSVARQLDSVSNSTSALSGILQPLVSKTNSSAANALNQMSGEQYTNFLFTAGRVQQQFIRTLYEPLRDLISTKQEFSCCKKKVSVWVSGSGGHSLLKNKNGFEGMSMKSYEISLGVHSTFCEHWTIGLASTYEHDFIDYRLNGSGSTQNWIGGLYSLYRPDPFYLLMNFIGGYGSNTLKRSVTLNDVTRKIKSNPDNSQLAFYSEAGFDVHTRRSLIQPFLGIEAGHIHQNQIHEHSHAGLDLNFAKKIQNNISSRLGLHITGATEKCLLFGLDVAWQYRFTKASSSLQASFANAGEQFTLKGVFLPRNSVDGALFINTPIGGCWKVFTKLSGQLWRGANSYNLIGGIETSW